MIHRILLPLDGSELAEAGLAYTLALHRAFGSEVVLLRVVEAEPGRPGLFSESMAWRLAGAEAHCYLKRVAERFEEWGVEVETDVAAGDAADEILDAVRRWNADMVVLTSHGVGEAVSFPYGGTTGKVVSSADTSFLVVRPSDVEKIEDPALERILVPMDGSSRSEWALNLAASLARAADADLSLVHVVPRPELLRGAEAPAEAIRLAERLVEANRAAAVRYLDERAAQLASPDLRVEGRVVVAASVPRGIHELARQVGSSLLVLSAHGRAAGSGWAYGGVAWALLSHARGPVLVFQDLPRRRPPRARGTGRYARAAARTGATWSE